MEKENRYNFYCNRNKTNIKTNKFGDVKIIFLGSFESSKEDSCAYNKKLKEINQL